MFTMMLGMFNKGVCLIAMKNATKIRPISKSTKEKIKKIKRNKIKVKK